VHCIDRRLRFGLLALGVLAGCSSAPPPASAPAPVVTARPSPAPAAVVAPAPVPSVAGAVRLPAPGPVRNWNELRKQAAQRMVAANPGGTYMGQPPDPLLAIPVLEIELNSDGSVRRIETFRQPREAKDTIQLAHDAVHRAAPFGDVSRLPKPWKFTESFLFNDERKFKPRTLD
jgi:hypothetical protein